MKKNVFVFGLGFVGYPLMLILANKGGDKKELYNLTGVEANFKKRDRITHFIKRGMLPFNTSDLRLKKLATSKSSKKINIVSEDQIDKLNGIILICISFDGIKNIKKLKKFFSRICKKVQANSTIIIETTLIPGTCEKILYPILKSKLNKKINLKKIFFGFSYERIMPGNNYVNSIINNYKSVSGINSESKIKILKFYKSFINYKKYPLTSFEKISECETAKIVENSYRAVNISFIDEWNKFAKQNKLNLKKIINSIKVRSSHSNIMRPGIGVGGYCLTKDPRFGEISSKIFKRYISFPLSTKAIKINNQMPSFCYKVLIDKIKKIKSKRILLLGSAYKSDVSDIRHSPAIKLFNILKMKKLNVLSIDPMIDKEKFYKIYPKKIKNFDIILFCVPHKFFQKINTNIFNRKSVIFDFDYVLNSKQVNSFKKKNIKIFSLGDYSE